MKIITDEKKIEEVLTRGVEEIIVRKDLEEKLKSGKILRIKLGIDPTSPDIHIGRAIPLLKLRDFQELGHKIIFIVGDFTGVIGDTSDKDSERPMLSDEVIKKNMKDYVEQAGKIIDLSKCEIFYNSKWLSKLTYGEIGVQADCFSLSDFSSRENIKRRLDAGNRVSLREVLYPLMQGYDSVAVKADVEIGGTDQRFNLLAGRKLQEKYGQTSQNIIMNPLLIGIDGRKMSSSWGNTINLKAEPSDMYGKVMSLSDSLIVQYFELTTRVPMSEVKKIKEMNPRDAKMRLAFEIVKIYHEEKKAKKAEENFIKTFQKKEIPEEIEETKCKKGELLSEVLVKNKILSSKGEWRRLVLENAVHNLLKNENIKDINLKILENLTLKIGKKRFVKIIQK
ncbi:MAG: tyrosine--tRNA ligase [Candidatus Paceibacterota bacterium]